MEKYEFLKDIGSGSFGIAKLMRNKETRELVAVKFIERGPKINENVVQEVTNHRSLRHPNVVRFKEVVLFPTHLGIVMEYSAGGELSERVLNAGRFSEDEARYFFQQLISGVNYCHFMKISHRDLKLENTLLDGSPAPRVKICDFGYSKSSVFHSTRESAVGTPAYMAPEVLTRGEYDGKLADVWSCGVTLYVMLVGAYPFDDDEEPKNFKNILQRILGAEYKIPDYVSISRDCRHLLSRIFVALPTKRITIEEIKHHPWFLKNLARELMEAYQVKYYAKENPRFSVQSTDEIMTILMEAKTPALNTLPVSSFIQGFGLVEEEKDDDPMISDVRLPERSIVPKQLRSWYLNQSSQLRWAASSSIDPLNSKYSAQAAMNDPMMSDVCLAERSIGSNRYPSASQSILATLDQMMWCLAGRSIKPNKLHLDQSASQVYSAGTGSSVDSNNLDSSKTLFDVSMSDVRPAERSVELDYSHSSNMNQ